MHEVEIESAPLPDPGIWPTQASVTEDSPPRPTKNLRPGIAEHV